MDVQQHDVSNEIDKSDSSEPGADANADPDESSNVPSADASAELDESNLKKNVEYLIS